MSVDAINQHRSSFTPAIETGILGATAGYFMAGRPNLEKVFTMTPDTFETETKEATQELKADVQKVREGLNEIQSIKMNDAVKTAFEDKVDAQVLEDGDEAITRYKKSMQKYEDAFQEKINAGKSIDEAIEELDKSDLGKALDKAENGIKEAKEKIFRASVTEESPENIKNIIKNYDEEVIKLAEAKSNKIAELAGKDEYKNAFNNIKKLFPKEGRWKNAGIWGGIALLVGTISNMVASNSNRNA